MLYNLYRVCETNLLLITSSLNKEWLIEQATSLAKEHPDWLLTIHDQEGSSVWGTDGDFHRK